MTYDEAIKVVLTRKVARREIERHDSEGWNLFIADCGDRETYRGSVVLDWLGY